jgi:hypothetical protein
MDPNNYAPAGWLGERQFVLWGLYEAVVLFQVFVCGTRTPVFICLHKDWDRRVSVVSKDFWRSALDPFGSKQPVG